MGGKNFKFLFKFLDEKIFFQYFLSDDHANSIAEAEFHGKSKFKKTY